MEKEYQVTAPSGNVINIREDMPEEARVYIVALYKRIDPEFSKTSYGHAAMAIATSTLGSASFEKDPEKILVYFRNLALKTIKEHGPKILPLLRDELRLALTDEDLKNLSLDTKK
jgi:hypothetical protein